MFTVTSKSDTGWVRGHNEDSTAVDLETGVVVVADGMGGYRAGEVASAIAVTCIVRGLRRVHRLGLDTVSVDGSTGSTQLRKVIEQANRVVYDAARENTTWSGMGTTLVAMLLQDNTVSIANVGDSRAYRWRNGQLKQLTHDHTVRQEMIDRHFYSPEEASLAVSGNLITRALGLSSDIHVDIGEHPVQPGDRYLLCTDGLSDMVDDSLINNCLSTERQPDSNQAADALVNYALQAGGEDNVSVLVVDIPRSKRPQHWLRNILRPTALLHGR